MAHAAGEGGSSKGNRDMMGIWREESKTSRNIGGPSSYRLFPEPEHSHSDTTHLLDSFSRHQPPPHITFPKQQGTSENETSMNVRTPVFTSGSSSRFSRTPAMTQHSSYIPSNAPSPVEGSLEEFVHIMAVQRAFTCALQDTDQITPLELLHKSPDALENHYAITRQPERISGSSQMQHFGRGDMNHSGNVQQSMRPPVDNSFGIISRKGQIVDLCVNPDGSRLIQQALETATPEEILMVYEEVIPYARMLATDVFANHVVQKLIEQGPQFYKRKFISNFIGHVLPLSLHMYGCSVIQKAFEVADHELKVQMANEFCGNALKCARDQYANHVLQKCIECVPAQHIQFIFRSFCRMAKELSTTTYGCHVIRKVLTFCSYPEIYQTLVSEIIEAIVMLALDPFGNYVVQHVIEHGGPVERSAIVKKLGGRFLRISYHKHASNVVEKCLAFGSFRDRQLIITEILTAGDLQHFDHLLDMMCHLYANFVIKKLATVAEKGQLNVLAEVARRNANTILRYSHGKHVLTHIQSVVLAQSGRQ